MKRTRFTIIVVATLGVFSASVFALTVTRKVGAKHVRATPEIAVTAKKSEKGLIDFTITLTTKEPQYVVAHLELVASNRVAATSDTPAFTRNHQHEFHFSMLPKYVEQSRFSLGVSHFVDTDGGATPLPGTIEYDVVLGDFVPPEKQRQQAR